MYPSWFYLWFQHYWVDSWTSFYDWTSGYVYHGQQLNHRHLLPMGRVYTGIGLVLLVLLARALVRRRKELKTPERLLLPLGAAAPCAKFSMDFHLKVPFPAIRFGLPYAAGLAFLVPFALTGNVSAKTARVVLWCGVALNAVQLVVGAVHNGVLG